MRIDILQSGEVRGKRAARGARRYFPGGWSDETLPVQAFAVTHPAGVCLFDAGQSFARAPHPGLHPFLRLARFELSATDEVGAQVDPATVRWLVLSHLHTDHVGSVPSFPEAEVIVSRTEWERARGWRGRARGYVPHHWPAHVVPRLVEPGPPALGPFAGAYDVAGDGSLLVVPTPGHTPGHMSLLIDTGRRRVLLAGDAARSAHELPRVAPALGAWCAAEGVTVLAAHDREAHTLVKLLG
jgi:glyoxylase-like metal-dependent hydrolase (beta-lactamase superfamily II)